MAEINPLSTIRTSFNMKTGYMETKESASTFPKTLFFYLVYIVALLPVFIFRDYTPDNELRYLSIVDEALSNHTFFAFTNHGIPYADKPPLFLWGMMALRSMAGGHYFWLYSILVILPAIATTLIFDRWTRYVIPSDSRLVSQGMLLVSGLFIASTLVLRMDMLMCMFIVLSFYSFWQIKENTSNIRAKWLFPVFIFLAVFTKGPYGILIPLVSTIVYSLWMKRGVYFLNAWGWRCWTVLVPLCALWFSCVYWEGGEEYLNNLLFHQTMDRAVNSFHHAKPFYYYLVSIWYSLIPWSLAMAGLIISGILKKKRTEGLQTYFTVISLTTLVLLSCVSSKIQIYLLPAIPFMVYAFAISLPRYQDDKWVKIGLAIIGIIFVLVLPAFAILLHIKPQIFPMTFWCWIAAGVLSLSGLVCIVSLYLKDSKKQVKNGMFAMIFGLFATLFFAGFAMPHYNDNIGYRNLSEKVNEISETTGITDVKCWGVRRPENIDVYLHRDVDIINDENYSFLRESSRSEPYILITDEKRCETIGCKVWQSVGKYVITVIE